MKILLSHQQIGEISLECKKNIVFVQLILRFWHSRSTIKQIYYYLFDFITSTKQLNHTDFQNISTKLKTQQETCFILRQSSGTHFTSARKANTILFLLTLNSLRKKRKNSTTNQIFFESLNAVCLGFVYIPNLGQIHL